MENKNRAKSIIVTLFLSLIVIIENIIIRLPFFDFILSPVTKGVFRSSLSTLPTESVDDIFINKPPPINLISIIILILGITFIFLFFKKLKIEINKSQNLIVGFLLIIVVLQFVVIAFSLGEYYVVSKISEIKEETVVVQELKTTDFKKVERGYCEKRKELILKNYPSPNIIRLNCLSALFYSDELKEVKPDSQLKIKTGVDAYGNKILLELFK